MQPIPYELFLERTKFPSRMLSFINHGGVTQIIPLRAMKAIDAIIEMPDEYLMQLLRTIGLVDAPHVKVYEKSTIQISSFNPAHLYVGQTFVSRRKYIALVENFQTLFERNNGFYLLKGISKLAAAIILGKDENSIPSLAHYVPPIIEMHDKKPVIMDGIHRNFVLRISGTDIWSIVIGSVGVSFPCSVRPWKDIVVTDDKPERKEDRFFDLRMHLFRDLNYVGIDG